MANLDALSMYDRYIEYLQNICGYTTNESLNCAAKGIFFAIVEEIKLNGLAESADGTGSHTHSLD